MRRALVVLVVLVVLATVVVGGHLYLARRLILDPAWPDGVRRSALVMLAVAGGALVVHPFAERWSPAALARPVAWLASVWMGLAFLLLVSLAATDALALLLGALVTSAADAETLARLRAFLVVGLTATAGIAGLRAALRAPVVRRIEVALARWPRRLDGFRIVQVSDVHIGPLLDRHFAATVTARCNALAPDLVAITGDLVDGSVGRLADEVEPFHDLRARHGVFFVTGNHDYYSGADEWAACVAGLGIRVLRNERVAIDTGRGIFDVAGVEDHHAHLVSRHHREDLDAALAGRDPDRAVVLLAHDPATFAAATRHGVDLQLSGHTHGGQLWPFAWFVRLSTPYVCGAFRRDGSHLYVSRGTGFWGPAMRLAAPAEITEIVLRAADCSDA